MIAKVLPPMLVALFLVACDERGGGHERTAAVKQTDIVAPLGEPSFPQKYHLKLTLPMPEAEFIALVDRLKLYYQVCGERGTDIGLPPLRQQSTIDTARFQKCYDIIGDRDFAQRIGEGWRAFTDRNHRVIYIENDFAYTGP
ncbi:MAG TPA: hypothetical protein VHE81_07510 [Lacipirellulaceae bacterium]|nr:hypothetical protein [Lacipirellulaceae bacterium]